MLRWKSVLLLLVLALTAASLSGGASFYDSPLPDLVVEITGPSSAKAGDQIGDQVTVEVNNLGSTMAPGRTPDGKRTNSDGYTVEIVLSSYEDVPVQPSRYYSIFRDGAQLHGGLIGWTPDVNPGYELQLWPSNQSHERDLQIPPDTPSGDYFVCAVVDPLGTVDEEDESNNVDCAPLNIQGGPSPPSAPDETPNSSPEPAAPPALVSVPDLASPITRLKVDEDAPEVDVELSPLLGDDYARIDWAKLQSNDNPDLVTARVSRGVVTFRFAKDRHGAAHVVIDGVDLEGFLFTLVMFIDVEPTNDLPLVAVPMGEMQVQSGSGDIPLDLLQVFTDADLPYNHDRLTFRTSNDNPHLLSFSLQDSDLTLHPQPGKHGEANITVTATDQSGISTSDTLRLVVEADDLTTEPENEIEEPSLQQKNGDSSSEKASTNGPSVAPTPSPDAASEEPESRESPESGDSPVDVLPATTSVPEPSEASDPNGNDAQVEAPTPPPAPGPGASQGIDSSKTDSPDTGLIVAGVDTLERDASEDEAHADAEVQQQTLKVPANASASMIPEVAGTTSPVPLPPAPASAAPIPAPEPSPASGSASAQAALPTVASTSAGTLPELASDTSSQSPATKVTLTAPNGEGPLSGRVLVVVIALMGVALAAVMALLVHIRRGHAT